VSLLLPSVSHGEPAGDDVQPQSDHRLGRHRSDCRLGHLRWGAVLAGACLPALGCYLAVALLLAALTAAAGAGSSVGALAQIAAVGWLAAHHIPLIIDGSPLGVLPLLLTLILGVLVARGAAGVAKRSRISRPGDAGWVAAASAGVHGIGGAVLALVATPATITVDPALAAVGCAVVAGAAAGIGLVRPCGLLPAALCRAPGWVLPGVLAGLWELAVLLTAGLATVLIAAMVSAPDLVRTLGPNAGSAFGLIVLSIGYLPNATIAGVSWLAGPGFSIGALSASPFAVHAAPVPAVPLLVALPPGPPQSWWVAVVLVPLLAGAAVGRRCTPGRELPERLRVLGAAGGTIALGSVVLGLLAGGRLGSAAFDPVDIPSGPLAAALLGATLLGGCATIVLPPPRARPEDDGSAVVAEFDNTAVEAAEGSPDVELGDDSAAAADDDSATAGDDDSVQ
jgi:hypothetical protein